MGVLVNVFFTITMLSVFGFFILNLRKSWLQISSVGVGTEENRTDNMNLRVRNMLLGGFLQKKMFKDMVPGIMHFFIFWGFVIVSLGTAETILRGVLHPYVNITDIIGDGLLFQLFLSSQDFGNFIVFSAISFAIARRMFFAPPRLKSLSKDSRVDAFIVLGFIFSLVFTSLLFLGSIAFIGDHPGSERFLTFSYRFAAFIGGSILGLEQKQHWEVFSEIFWWLHVGSLFGFMLFLPFSKHQHLIWVWPNMLFKSLKSSGRIRPMEFDEDAESFGVGQAKDFTWKQLLDGMACVECGRCTSVCPANSTGKALDPRLMIHHLKTATKDAIANPEPEKQKPLIGEIVSKEELWDCTTCGACMEACPLHIEHIPAIIDMRRYLTMTEGDMPAELQSSLENLETQSNPWGISNNTRGDWAKGLSVTTMAENSDVEYLFWVGCAGSFDERYKKVSKSIAKIMNQANVKFSILGSEEQCNGDTARRAGNEYLADMQIKENIETFKRYQVKKVVTGCPHCFNTIKNEYPDFGMNLEVIHHSELISNLIKDGKVKATEEVAATAKTTYHDSCYLGRHNGVYASPRETLESLPNTELTEMPRNKENGFCCGAGGARMWMEETSGSRINVNRAEEAIKTGSKTIATACPFCMTMMTDGVTSCGKETEVEVKDIAEIVADRISDTN